MSPEAPATPSAPGLEQAPGRPQAIPRWAGPLSAAAVVFVVAVAWRAHPAPGAHGKPLAVTLALIGFSAAIAGVIWLNKPSPAFQLPLLLVAVLSSAALVGLQSNGPGFLGLFPAVGMAALRLPPRLSGAVAGVAIAAVAVAYPQAGHRPVAGIVLDEFGVVAFYLTAMFARRHRESNERAGRLLAELEQTRAAQAQAATLAERQRLAREMHDVLAHSLSGLVLNLEGARLLARRDGADPQIGEAIDRAHRLARTGLAEARRAIGMLHDEALPGPERLAGLAAEFEGDSGVACTLTVTGQERELGTDGRLTLYRVAQESMTNVRKHARADRVELRLAYEPAGTRLTIEDFATAADRPPPGDGTGYGLTGMRERAELLGGALTAGPTGSGFRVELWVPA